jgi:TfoX/Sxy family transcriptional regulator of competence genes
MLTDVGKEDPAMTERHPPGNGASLALLDTLGLRFSEDPLVERGTMFRSPGMKVGGKVFAFLGSDDRLTVKIPRARAEAAVASGAAEPVTMGTRTMKEWVAYPAVPHDPVETEQQRSRAIDEAYAYVKSLRSE